MMGKTQGSKVGPVREGEYFLTSSWLQLGHFPFDCEEEFCLGWRKAHHVDTIVEDFGF